MKGNKIMKIPDAKVAKDAITGVGFVLNKKTGLVVHSSGLTTMTKIGEGEDARRFFRRKQIVSELSIPPKPVAFACVGFIWHWPFPFPKTLRDRVADFVDVAIEVIIEEVHRTNGEATAAVEGAGDLYATLIVHAFEFYDLITVDPNRSWEEFAWERKWLKAFGN